MSEFVEPGFIAEEFLDRVDSDVLNAITEYDAAKKKYFGLAATIRNDLPFREEFEGPLDVGVDEISHSFGEVVLATYESYGLQEGKKVVANLWYCEQEERVAYISALVACTNIDCHEYYSEEEIQGIVDDIFIDSVDEDELLANAKTAYLDMLRSDAQGFMNHIGVICNEPRGFLSLQLLTEIKAQLNTESIRRKIAKLSGFALGLSISGAIISKFIEGKEQ